MKAKDLRSLAVEDLQKKDMKCAKTFLNSALSMELDVLKIQRN